MLEQRLKELRKAAGFSQKTLSEKLSVSQQTVAKWETGGATPNPEMLSAIADVFEVSVDYLIGRTNAFSDDEAIKFALFGGANVDDETFEEVKRFAKFTQEKNNR